MLPLRQRSPRCRLRRIMLVNMTVDAVQGGGTAERTRQLARHLAKSGYRCILVTTTDRSIKKGHTVELEGVDTIGLPILNRRYHIPILQPFRLWSAIRSADMVHCMNHWTLINAVVCWLAALQRKPVALCPAGALRVVGRSQWLKRLYALLVGDWMIRNARGLILIADNERGHLSRGAARAAVRRIPNGIDPLAFKDDDVSAFRSRYALPAESPLILFMGRLDPIKGPDILLKAFARQRSLLADHHLVFAGPDGGLQTGLEALCRQEGLSDRVHFIGYVGGAEKSQAYHAARYLVIPSRQEAMSIVALEAGVSGTPVLLTDACGFDEVAGVGGGMVVPPHEQGVAEGLAAMSARGPDLPNMGAALRRYVLAHYTWEEIALRHVSFFEELTA